MLNSRALALIMVLSVVPQMVHAAEDAARCVDVSAPKRAVEAQHGKWIELTSDQWQFLRGIYAMNPMTPPGLPYGDKAALATWGVMTAAWCSFSTATEPARRCWRLTPFSR